LHSAEGSVAGGGVVFGGRVADVDRGEEAGIERDGGGDIGGDDSNQRILMTSSTSSMISSHSTGWTIIYSGV
jgi:hypothetical protein